MNHLQIGDWVLESDLNQVSTTGNTVYLGALKTRLLEFLAANPGRVIGRDELAREVWGGFASDHTINQHIAMLRKFLGAQTDQAYIQTVPKRGYRLIAPVSDSREAIEVSASQSVQLANIRVAVVDDSEFINDYLNTVLSGIGLKSVATFLSVEEAENAFLSTPFDLVLCDVVMEPINGLELIKRIRTGVTALDPFTAVIVMTSFAETDVLGSAILLDVNGFLTKPVDMPTLKEKLIHALTEDFQYRPSLAYRHIDVSFVDQIDRVDDSQHPVTDGVVSESGRSGGRSVDIDDLREGMVLAIPVIARDGSLILPAGTVLSRTNIFRIREIAPIVLADRTVEIA